MKKTASFVIAFMLAVSFFALPQDTRAAFDCMTLTPSSSQANKDYCKQELAVIEAQLQELLAKQAAQQKQTGTLAGDVSYLTSQINALKKKIQARSLAIAQLQVSISEKNSTIKSLSDKIDREHEYLAELLRDTNEFDQKGMVDILLSSGSISNFYQDLQSYTSIKQAIQNSIDLINGTKTETESQKQSLQQKQNAETDAKAELVSAQSQVAKSEADKRALLAISQQKQNEYEKLAAEKRAQAERIRAALFPLAGTSTKIDFGTALQYATEAQRLTGIDPAFLLAILTQESNLGANVGQCYLTHTDGPMAGYGANINSGKVWPNLMKASRDVQPFLDITSKLGIDPLKTPVSCPIAGVAGYGGAMGPAQFIPSTWALFVGRLKNLLGYDADPWRPRDAFMASALYLTDLGAIGSSQSAQNRAACRYYGSGGSSCSYSRSVASLKSGIQANIDYINQYGAAPSNKS